MKARKQTRRGAFTLIELLVVILIITLLISLTSAAVFKALNKVADVTNTHDITDLATAVVNFEGKYKVEYIPSRLYLAEAKDNYFFDPPADTMFKSQLHQDSFTYLGKVWTKLDWTSGIDWNNDGAVSNDVTLEGDQCLVFFLGGIQVTQAGNNACLGFSTNPRNPATVGGDRIQPFFDFKSERLTTKFHPTTPPSPPSYFSYLDAYGKVPFAYFSSYKKGDGYWRYTKIDSLSDCNTLGVYPYAALFDSTNNPLKFQNSETFQIISAGRDGQFGMGFFPGWAAMGLSSPPVWNPATAESSGAILLINDTTKTKFVGRDDMANFYDRQLGTPAN